MNTVEESELFISPKTDESSKSRQDGIRGLVAACKCYQDKILAPNLYNQDPKHAMTVINELHRHYSPDQFEHGRHHTHGSTRALEVALEWTRNTLYCALVSLLHRQKTK